MYNHFKTAKEVSDKLGGEWIHTQDDNFPPFFDAVGTYGIEKEYMLSSTPRFILKADGETIKTTTIPHPNTEPDLRADVEFKLGEEYVFEPREHVLKIVPDWKDNKLIQTIQPVQSHMKPHVIEMYVNSDGDLVQAYITENDEGKQVIGKRKYKRDDNT